MKAHKVVLVKPAFVVCLAAALTGEVMAQDNALAGMKRFALLTVGQSDYYVPIQAGFSIDAADRRIGPNNAWFKSTWVTEGKTMSNWNEMMSFLILPSNAPPIDVMAAQLSKSCPKSFTKIDAAAPEVVFANEGVKAVQMQCAADDTSPISLNGYYVAVRTKDYSYMLSVERRHDARQGKQSLDANVIEDWRRLFSKFAICAKGDVCMKL